MLVQHSLVLSERDRLKEFIFVKWPARETYPLKDAICCLVVPVLLRIAYRFKNAIV